MSGPVTLKQIERFLVITGWGHTRFGRAAADDKNLVTNMRAGRQLNRGVGERVQRFMIDYLTAEAEKVAKLRRLIR